MLLDFIFTCLNIVFELVPISGVCFVTGKSTFKHDKTTFKVDVYFCGKKLNCLHGSRHFETKEIKIFSSLVENVCLLFILN